MGWAIPLLTLRPCLACIKGCKPTYLNSKIKIVKHINLQHVSAPECHPQRFKPNTIMHLLIAVTGMFQMFRF